MMNIDNEDSTSVQVRATKFKPRRSFTNWLIGKPLQTADAPHQTIGILIGLAVFSSDALSSLAYGPQELMMMLAAAGVVLLQYSLPLVLCIVGL